MAANLKLFQSALFFFKVDFSKAIFLFNEVRLCYFIIDASKGKKYLKPFFVRLRKKGLINGRFVLTLLDVL